ncbi:hypothetical protein BDZ91DRAFT_666180, partial [Kalaharituber pfeilii]
LVRADLLHNIYQGMLKHLMDWVISFLEDLKRIHIFNKILSALPPDPGFTPATKRYRAVTQWSGKEMRNLSRVLLGVFAATVTSQAILCIRYFMDFYLIAQYRTHTDETVNYMRQYLEKFHVYKSVFLQYRAGKTTAGDTQTTIQVLSSEHRSEVASAKEKLSKTQVNRLQCETRFEREILRVEMLEKTSHFNFPKMHLISYYADQIK